MSEKEKILIADDSAMNRAILTEMLGDGYEILEAENGRQAVSIMQTNVDIDLLLDIMMPEMDGFDVLAMMNKYHWIDDIPVIMISAENASSYVERAYDLGATDYISRPFDMAIVRRRVINTLMLYAKQKRLVRLVAEQVYEKEKSNSTMINILSHIVEFRNGESGLHVLHIQTATDILLRTLVRKNDKYNLNAADISLISTASALHDIGKINIPASILNKPGKLTKEEFDTMKTHTTTGAEILDKLPFQQESPLVKTAYAICRWHHERWDGRGYPDGLKGEDIPIAAQVVAMADVYDALTSERCYKKAFGHDKAMEMILNGECGQFNPLLLECLTDAGARLHAELSLASSGGSRRNYLAEAQHISEVLLHEKSLPGQDHILRTLSVLRTKANFFAENARCVQFDYSEATGLVRFSPWAVEHMQVPEELHLPDEADRSGFAIADIAYAICRWHHERWDGRGYPDGLKGEDIPIAAQVVAMADVYDALTSERCYKKAFGHDKAMEMILNGECGQFNPLLLECLTDAGARLHAELSLASSGGSRRNYLAEAQHISEVLLHEKSLPGQDHILRTLSVLRTKANFFAENARCVQFDYSEATGLVRFSPWAVEHMQVPEELHLPDEADRSGFAIADIDRIRTALRATTVNRPHAELSMLLPIDGELRWHHVSLCALWSDEIPPLYIGAVGQANPV